jgi:lysophospholipase L1-like esterase
MSYAMFRRTLCGAVPLAAGASLLLAAAAPPRPAPLVRCRLPVVARRIAQGKDLRIIAFGSSSTEGVGASSPLASYPSRLQDELKRLLAVPLVVLNRGVGGEDADDMLRRLPAVLAERPHLIIWQTGTNDPLRRLPLARFIAETKAGVAAMRSAGVDVILMGPQLCSRLQHLPGSSRYRWALSGIGAEMGVPVIHRYTMMQAWLAQDTVAEAALFAPDGLHMADGGYALLGREVARQIVALVQPATGYACR